MQKLQIWLQENAEVQLQDYLEENMTILEQTDRKLYLRLQENETNNRDLFYNKYEMTLAINGQPTLHVRRGQYDFFYAQYSESGNGSKKYWRMKYLHVKNIL